MYRSTLRRLLSIGDPPERTALAFSIGVFIAFSPLLGLHTIIATFLAFVFKFNKIAIYAGTFVNNPLFTMVPIIVASYTIGAFFLGKPLTMPREDLRLLEHPHLFTSTYWTELLRHSTDALAPFAVGGFALSVVSSLLAYALALKLLRLHQKSKGLSPTGKEFG